jgi:hypothetical protein
VADVVAHLVCRWTTCAMRRRVHLWAGEPVCAGALAERRGELLQVGVRQPGLDAAGPPCCATPRHRRAARRHASGWRFAWTPSAGGRPRPAEQLGRLHAASLPAGKLGGGTDSGGRRVADASWLACPGSCRVAIASYSGPASRSPQGPKPYRREPAVRRCIDAMAGPGLAGRSAGHGSPPRRARTSKPAPPGQPPAGAGRREPSFSGDDLVLWQVMRTSPAHGGASATQV